MATSRARIAGPIDTPLARPRGRAAPLHAEPEIRNLAREFAADRRAVRAGAPLFAEDDSGDSLYLVLDGWLFSFRILEDGRRQILDFALPGAVLGYRSAADRRFPYSVEALTDAVVAAVSLSRLGSLQAGRCAAALLAATNDALLDAFDSLTDAGRRTAREAVAHFLLRMDRRIRCAFGAAADGSVPFPPSQVQIADALGLTPVHVCRMLGRLRDEGLVETGRGRLRILRADLLSGEAGLCARAGGRRSGDHERRH